MNTIKINNIVKEFRKTDYKTLAIALIAYEKTSNDMTYEELTIKDIKELDNIYNKFMDNDNVTGLLNDYIMEMLEGEDYEN
jgi:formamidopyrimidine-DNA glycosylase